MPGSDGRHPSALRPNRGEAMKLFARPVARREIAVVTELPSRPTRGGGAIRARATHRLRQLRWPPGSSRPVIACPAPYAPAFEVRGLHRSFYGIRALDGVDLVVEPGTITGLIGPNGAGKTTLFNCVSGIIPPERRPRGLRRPRHHGMARRSRHAGRTGAYLPDRARLSAAVRAREPACSTARGSRASQLTRGGAARRRRPATRGGAARRAPSRWPAASPWSVWPTIPPPRCRADRRSCWSSGAR